jgi:Flp pilus assembly protein protease CpaA
VAAFCHLLGWIGSHDVNVVCVLLLWIGPGALRNQSLMVLCVVGLYGLTIFCSVMYWDASTLKSATAKLVTTTTKQDQQSDGTYASSYKII